ncbi:MAG: chromosomal replication initiator protein DnaA [Bacillota bacterium]|nr:chromosomal replication initiator protein DnaA [Bacillota bacterium]
MEQVWQKALLIIKNNVYPHNFERWFSPTAITEVKRIGNTVYICVAEEWVKTALIEFYLDEIKNALFAVTDEQLNISVIDLSAESLPAPPSEPETAARTVFVNNAPPVFNPRYTFENFVVGASNRFSHAAAMAVAESPSRSYNPLFIYGGSGLGKTHLMHAIGCSIINSTPEKKVVYVSSEAFTNEFIYLLRENRMETFKNRYRSTDILLIDDIQFLAKKNQIQEEFFHTFNALHDAGKQIVISSDRHPKEINPLEERLRSRFEWGLITDIQPPDWETRCAILQRKAEIENVSISDDVTYYIAEKIEANIRELEGALNKVMYYGELNGIKHIDLDFAKEALRGTLPDEERPKATIPLIQKTVAEYYNISVTDMTSKKKDRFITYPRQIAMYLCRDIIDATQSQIGRDFGGRDHTTVIHACDKISNNRLTNSELDRSLNELTKMINGK